MGEESTPGMPGCLVLGVHPKPVMGRPFQWLERGPDGELETVWRKEFLTERGARAWSFWKSKDSERGKYTQVKVGSPVRLV